jgi:hypothetical protein
MYQLRQKNKKEFLTTWAEMGNGYSSVQVRNEKNKGNKMAQPPSNSKTWGSGISMGQNRNFI